jgi:flagellar basal-body rod protein FlgF
MDRLVFTAHTAMSEQRLDRQSMTHELANVSTVGFKKAYQVANRAVRTEGDGFDTRFLPRAFTTAAIDLKEGPRMITGRPLDIAMNESTVLGVQADDGSLAWTRRGDLRVDVEGFLTTGSGYPVLDDAGAQIQMPVGSVLYEITEDGSISVMDPSAPENGALPMARLMLRDASAIDLGRREDGLFRPLAQTEDGQDFVSGPRAASVTPGALEGSNVSTVHTLVKFIDHMRSFEMQTKVIKEMKDNDASGASMMRVS